MHCQRVAIPTQLIIGFRNSNFKSIILTSVLCRDGYGNYVGGSYICYHWLMAYVSTFMLVSMANQHKFSFVRAS